MTAATKDLEGRQGRTFSETVTYTDANGAPISLTGYTAKFQVRERADSANAVVSLTQADGLVLGNGDGTITIGISAVSMAALAADFNGVYELEVLAPTNGPKIDLLVGQFYVLPSVCE